MSTPDVREATPVARRRDRAGGALAAGEDSLVGVLERLRDVAADLRLPLTTDGAAEGRRIATELAHQLDDYLLPRIRRLDAPVLAVVGGSTGAGKSTLVNALVGAVVTRPGVLRPTTRSPVLVHHPDDADDFTEQRVLPGLPRSGGAGGTGSNGGTGGTGAIDGDVGGLRLVASSALPPGLAILDAPDIDSVVSSNRDLAAQLLAAADFWLFVTTAARYADAVPWDFLRRAADRGTAVAVVLDRVSDEEIAEIRPHLAAMLREHRLVDSPLFVVPEVPLRDGQLPPEAVAELRGFLVALAEDAEARADVVRQTLWGALDSLQPRLVTLAAAVDAQAATAARLHAMVRSAYDEAGDRVLDATRDGSLLRGEVLARWQEFVGTGELMRNLESRLGRMRDKVVAAVTGRPAPAEQLTEALETGVEALVLDAAEVAAERSVAALRSEPAGSALLAAPATAADLRRSSPGLREQTARAVRDWQGGVLDLVRREAAGKRSTARILSYGINGAALVVMIAVFAQTGGLTGVEVVTASGASALGQRLLEALLGDQAVRELAAAARTDLDRRVRLLLAAERRRFDMLVDSGSPPEPAEAEKLRALARAVQAAR